MQLVKWVLKRVTLTVTNVQNTYLIISLDQESHELRQMISRLVLQPGKCVHVDLDLVPLVQVDDQCRSCHRIFVIVDVVLVEDAGDFVAVTSQRYQRFLEIVCADLQEEQARFRSKNASKR